MGAPGKLTFGGLSKTAPAKLAFGFKGAQKPRPLAAFAPDSDDDVEDTHAAKKQRTSTQERGGPRPPADPEVLKAADKLAAFVAANGRSFEEVTRQRNPDNSIFRFLFDKSGADYQYYDSRVRALQAGNGSALAASPAPAHHASASHVAPPVLPSGDATTAEAERRAAQRALRAGDSLAAMEAFAKMAAHREKEAPAAEPDEAAPRVDFLNETGFDRRKQMAVYKADGTKAHHMSDYIPQEELAKFLAKSGDKASAAAIENQQKIGDSNIGHKLLSKMGWKEGEGLGAKGSGIAAPVGATGAAGYSTLGLGAAEPGDPTEGGDSFELYRKRMMLGYKHRPNPNGNPRKQYNS